MYLEPSPRDVAGRTDALSDAESVLRALRIKLRGPPKNPTNTMDSGILKGPWNQHVGSLRDVLHYAILYCTRLYYTILYNAPYYTIPYYTVLYYAGRGLVSKWSLALSRAPSSFVSLRSQGRLLLSCKCFMTAFVRFPSGLIGSWED